MHVRLFASLLGMLAVENLNQVSAIKLDDQDNCNCSGFDNSCLANDVGKALMECCGETLIESLVPKKNCNNDNNGGNNSNNSYGNGNRVSRKSGGWFNGMAHGFNSLFNNGVNVAKDVTSSMYNAVKGNIGGVVNMAKSTGQAAVEQGIKLYRSQNPESEPLTKLEKKASPKHHEKKAETK